MKLHSLKCWPEYFEATKRGEKPFEVRKNDRDFQSGDLLRLRRYDPETKRYNGEYLNMEIVAVYSLEPWCPGFVGISIRQWETGTGKEVL